MCGVFGIRSEERDVSRLAYFGLFALQHRGQESAGIAVSDAGPPHCRSRDGARRPGLQRAAAPGAPRRGRDRAHALLHDGREPVGERPAAHPSRERADHRARSQRQPRERGGAARGARRRRRPADVGIRHGGDRGAGRPRSGPARRGCRERDGAARGRVLGHRPRRGHARRIPRPLRLPAADARPRRRGLGRRLGDVRARPDRRRRRTRRPPGRGRLGRRGRTARGTGGSVGPQRPLHLRARLLRAARLAARRGRGARRACAHGRAARARRRRSTRIS